MNENFDALLAGVRHANAMMSANMKPDRGDKTTGFGEFFILGVELAESMHWVATADSLTEMQRDESSYSLIADDINDKFDKTVVETFRDKPRGNVGFIHPETNEFIGFYS